ncbi:hypothetical protein Tco_0779164 [Tanacetum coccineum]
MLSEVCVCIWRSEKLYLLVCQRTPFIGESSAWVFQYFAYNCSGRSRTPVGQGSAVIVTADADCLPQTLGFNFFSSIMGTIDSMKSILTLSALDSLCEKFHIPDAVHPELPGRNDRIRNSPTVIRHCGRHGLSFRDLVPRPWFCSDRRKFPEPFLCFVGISRYYDLDDNCYPTFLIEDDEEMDLFAFIRHADPTKVRIGGREVGEGEVQLLELTRGRVVPLAGVNQGNQNEVVPDVDNQNDDAQDAGNDLIGGMPLMIKKFSLMLVLFA